MFRFVKRQSEDLRASGSFPNLTRRLDSIETRKTDVHDHDIRHQNFDEIDRRAPIGGLGADLEVLLGFEQGSNAAPDDCADSVRWTMKLALTVRSWVIETVHWLPLTDAHPDQPAKR